MHQHCNCTSCGKTDPLVSVRPEGYPETPILDKEHEIGNGLAAFNCFMAYARKKGIHAANPKSGELVSLDDPTFAKAIGKLFDIDYDALQKERAAVLKFTQEHK